jgi:hypothetical protein
LGSDGILNVGNLFILGISSSLWIYWEVQKSILCFTSCIKMESNPIQINPKPLLIDL